LKGSSERTREFARRSAIGALVLGCLGQVAYHLLAAAHWAEAPWPVTVGVACLPVVTLYFAATLTHMILADRRAASEARDAAERAKAEREAARTARAELPREPKPRRSGTGTKPKPVHAPEPEPGEVVDLDAENRILNAISSGQVDAETGILQLVANGRKASQAGVLAGRSDSYGRKVVRTARDLAAAAPKGQS
jgi:hypothetical protein